MKLLVVSQYFHPENFRVNELVATLVASGHEVTVLTGMPNYPQGPFFSGYGFLGPWQEDIFGAKVLRVPMLARGKGGGLALVLNYLSFAVAASIAVWTRLGRNYDAIFTFEVSPITVGIPAIVARARFKVPMLFWVLDLWPESVSAAGAIRSRMLLKTIAGLVRWIYARCDVVLMQSRAFGESIEAHGVASHRLHYFPNWIEAGYEEALPPAARPDDTGDIRIVYAGNIGAAQDFPAIVEAASMVRDRLPLARWIIAGDGRMAPWLKEEVGRRGLSDRFDFLGQLPTSAMPALFAGADALLVSLKADPVFALTIPGKVQSYLASGRPVLAMLDGEGARVIEDSEGGWVVPAGDAAGLAQKLEALTALSPADREAIGQQGRTYAMKEFGRQSLFSRLEELLRNAILECETGFSKIRKKRT